MSQPIAAKTRLQIRQSVGYNTGAITVSTSSTAGTVTTLVDAVGLARGANDEYKNSHLQSNAGASIGLKRWVTSSTAASASLVFATLGSGNAPASAEAYEIWRPPFDIDMVNAKLADAEAELAGLVLPDKEDHSVFTEADRYQYSIPSGFVAICSVEYVSRVEDEVTIDTCDAVWDELVDADVTASLDTTIEKEGSGCLKLVVAAGCGAGDILATQDTSALDLTDCTEVEIWIRSSVALDAGDIQLLLDNTASCASAVESLNIPATTANTWTRHVLTLANPESDSAIISYGLKMVTDKGAFTLYADDIIAVNANSRIFKYLPAEHWEIVKGSTPYLKLTQDGKAVTGNNCMLRLIGYQKFTAMSADTSTAQVDPDFLVNRVTGQLLLAYGARSDSDPKARMSKAQYYLSEADKIRHRISTSFRPGTKMLQ